MRPVFQGLAEILFYDWLSQLYWSLPAAPTFATSSLYTNNYTIYTNMHTCKYNHKNEYNHKYTHKYWCLYTARLVLTILHYSALANNKHWFTVLYCTYCCSIIMLFTAFYCSIGETKVVLRIHLLQDLLLYT